MTTRSDKLSDAIVEGPPNSMIAVGTFVRGGRREGIESASFTVSLAGTQVEIPSGLPLHVANKLTVRAGVIVLRAGTAIRIQYGEKSEPGIGPMRGVERPVIDGDIFLEVPDAPRGTPDPRPPWKLASLGRLVVAMIIVGFLVTLALIAYRG
jgi:hypothetical protein